MRKTTLPGITFAALMVLPSYVNYAIAMDTTTTNTIYQHNHRISDRSIQMEIERKIAASNLVNHTPIKITVQNNDVALSGTIATENEASEIIEIAQSVEGVNIINTDQLKITDSQQPFADTAITAKVKRLFIREKLFGNKDIAAITMHVETKNGVVYLSGTVDNLAQVRNAINIARQVKDVTDVRSTVTVKTATS